MFKSIVVAYDGSAHAGKALALGAEIVGGDKIPLGIIYVVDSSRMHIPEEMRKFGEVEHLIDSTPAMVVNFQDAPAAMMSSMAQASADTQSAMFQYADFLLGQAQQSLIDVGVQQVDYKVELGDPAEQIVAYASDRDADLIITGSRGFGKLKSLLLGSTSHKITQLAPCSCLTVK